MAKSMENQQLSRAARMATRLLLGLLAVGSTLAVAQTYRWVDPASGRTIFSDTPPPGTAKQVKKSFSAPPDGDKPMPYATKQAAQNFPVTLYTSAECGPCAKARELLTKRGVPFTEKTIQTEADQAELKALLGETTVPGLKVGRQTVKGFDASAYNSTLDLAGYPKASGAAQ